MNKIVEKAIKINEKEEWNVVIPNLEVGDICAFSDLYMNNPGDGNAEDILENGSYSILITNSGETGNENLDMWINYSFKIVEKREGFEKMIGITGIELL